MNKDLVQYILFFVQAVVEPLPFSSSTHVLLVGRILSLFFSRGVWPNPNFLVISNFSALLTFFPLIAYKFWPVLSTGRSGIFTVMRLILFIGLSCALVPVAHALIFSKFRDPALIWPTSMTLNLFLSALLLFSSAKFSPTRTSWASFCFSDALIVAPVQAAALIFPGLSRMGVTYWIFCRLGFAPIDSYLLSISQQIVLTCLAMVQVVLSGKVVFTLSSFFALGLCSMFGYASLYLAYTAALQNWFWKFAYYFPLPILLSIILYR